MKNISNGPHVYANVLITDNEPAPKAAKTEPKEADYELNAEIQDEKDQGFLKFIQKYYRRKQAPPSLVNSIWQKIHSSSEDADNL